MAPLVEGVIDDDLPLEVAGARERHIVHFTNVAVTHAPGATGNIVTEDLVFLLESMGLRTGIDLEKLIATRAIIAGGLPGEPLYGHLADAGLPKGFRYADGRAPA